MKKFTAFALLLLTLSLPLFAQQQGLSPEAMEKIKAEKISFLTNKLELTPAEAQKFWPVYNEFEQKKMEIFSELRSIERKNVDEIRKMKNADLEKLTYRLVELKEQESVMFKEYNKKFLSVLPPRKVVLLYQVENDWRAHMMREFRRSRN